MRNEFTDDSANAVTVVLPDSAGLSAVETGGYAADLARVPDVLGGVAGPGSRRQRST